MYFFLIDLFFLFTDLSYHKYEISRTHSFLDDRIDFSPFEENSQNRFVRSVLEPPKGTAKPQHELSEVQDMQQQQQPKVQPTTLPQQPVISINTHNSANVSYSTETISTENPVHGELPSKKYKPDVLKSKKNYTTATTPTVETSTSHLVSFAP